MRQKKNLIGIKIIMLEHIKGNKNTPIERNFQTNKNKSTVY